MLRSVRSARVLGLGASLSNTALVHTRFRLHAVENRRVVSEDMLLQRAYARTGGLSRPTLTILLDGEARISAHGEHLWISPGDVVVVDSKNTIRMRQAGERYASLMFEWEPSFCGGCEAPLARYAAAPLEVERLWSIWRGVRGDADPAATVESLLVTLRDVGVPITARPASTLREDVPPRMGALNAALDAALSNLAEQPMLRDFERTLGLSTRQVHRLVAEYNERYAFNSAGWIDTRNRRRLMMGATFMTVRGALAQHVATSVGYRSAAAFARALREAQLPSPTQIAAEVESIATATGRPRMSDHAQPK